MSVLDCVGRVTKDQTVIIQEWKDKTLIKSTTETLERGLSSNLRRPDLMKLRVPWF